MVHSVIYRDELTGNKERRFGSAQEYFPVRILDVSGREERAMFTFAELSKAITRAKNNPEDWPRKRGPWWQFWK